MHRICHSLEAAGFEPVLVGRQLADSKPLTRRRFHQKRLRCLFNKGFLFYAEYNVRLFFFLLFKKMDGICAIDLDTILPCLLVSKLKGIPRVYDAHEYFTELKEVRTRPRVQKVWLRIEKFAVPKFLHGYTVSQGLVQVFQERYNRNYALIRNLPILREAGQYSKKEKFIFYCGAANEGRGFEYLIPAMRRVPYKLVVCGDGNFMQQLKTLIVASAVQDKVELRGMVSPEELFVTAQQATLGVALAEKEGINQYHALPNKFLDYIHAGLPQVTMSYPEYLHINSRFEVAVLIDTLDENVIADAINATMENETLLERLHLNCLRARQEYCWQEEEKTLIRFYQRIFKK